MTHKEFMSFSDLVLQLTQDTIVEQALDGSFSGGRNGPHGDIETPVRNTAYWLYTLCWLIKQGHKELQSNANMAAEYLLSDVARPMKAAFWCRSNPEKNFSNGLIGQAWVIECINYAAKILNRGDLTQLAIEVHSMHKWNDDVNAWHFLNVDGSHGSIHGTFNQQLWFAAVGAQIDGYERGKKLALKYLDSVKENLWLYNDGVIFHDTRSYKKPALLKAGVKFFLRDVSNTIKLYLCLKSKRKRSVGYHAFNLVAFKYLQNIFPEHKFWGSNVNTKISNVYCNSRYVEDLNNNKFSYPYNPAGYEYAFFLDGDLTGIENMIVNQKEVVTISNKGVKIRDSFDESMTKSRLYELCRMLEGTKYE